MTLWSDLRILNNYAKPEEQERAPFRDWAEVNSFYQYLVSEAVSECRGEILEIILNGLSKSMATIKDADPSSLKHAKLPLSHPAWVEHRLVHEAAVRGDPEILHIVLDYGGDATSMDGFQRSTLHLLSVFSNNAESAGNLLDHGAHSLLDHRTEMDGMTAFMTAVANCNFIVADRLLRKTPNTERQTLLSSRPAGMAFAELSLFGHLIAWSTTVGEKPVEYLCSLPEIRETPDLLFIVDETNKYSALMMACGIKSGGGILDTELFACSRRRRTINLLVRQFPKQHHIDSRDNHGNTALHLAAFLGSKDTATALLEAGANPNLLNSSGASPLDVSLSLIPHTSGEIGLQRNFWWSVLKLEETIFACS